jgi:hypothetical protein
MPPFFQELFPPPIHRTDRPFPALLFLSSRLPMSQITTIDYLVPHDSFLDFPPDIVAPPVIVTPAVAQNMPTPPIDPTISPRKRPARIPGFVGTNAAYLVPDNIRRKFMEGWTSHVPLTYLTDKGCLLKNKALLNAAQDILSFDSTTGQVVMTSKVLYDNGELDLTFDEWHQAWRRLLELIKTFLPDEFLLWEVHYLFILNNENRAEMWPLYLAYDAEIRRRATQSPIDPSQFSIGLWNDLEARYTAKKVLSMVQADLKHNADRAPFPNSVTSSYPTRNPVQSSSFRTQSNAHHALPDNPKVGCCIFCGDRSKTHTPRTCTANCYPNGTPCHLCKQEPNGSRVSKSGRRYCYAWNGPTGCDQNPCRRGEHLCTLCGSTLHNAQQCDAVP